MGTTQLQLPCSRCGALTLHNQATPAHVLHLLLTFFTCGFWVVLWIFACLRSRIPECQQCALDVGRREPCPE